jgi:hypothetical protein
MTVNGQFTPPLRRSEIEDMLKATASSVNETWRCPGCDKDLPRWHQHSCPADGLETVR